MIGSVSHDIVRKGCSKKHFGGFCAENGLQKAIPSTKR